MSNKAHVGVWDYESDRYVLDEIREVAKRKGFKIKKDIGPYPKTKWQSRVVGYLVEGKKGDDVVFWYGELMPEDTRMQWFYKDYADDEDDWYALGYDGDQEFVTGWSMQGDPNGIFYQTHGNGHTNGKKAPPRVSELRKAGAKKASPRSARKPKPKPKPKSFETPEAYAEGRAARLAGAKRSTNPYAGVLRAQWMTGWSEAKPKPKRSRTRKPVSRATKRKTAKRVTKKPAAKHTRVRRRGPRDYRLVVGNQTVDAKFTSKAMAEDLARALNEMTLTRAKKEVGL
jgi:ribosome modulation factor